MAGAPGGEDEALPRAQGAGRRPGADARLSARNAELAAWADRAGHDLRSPLAVISGMAETLEAAWDRLGAEDRARMLASIRAQAARAMTLVDEAVALARGADPAGEADPTADRG